MTKKIIFAMILPMAAVILFAVLLALIAFTIGRPFLSYVETGNPSTINEATRLVLLIRAVVWPAILALLGVVTSRSDDATVGLLVAAAVGAIVAGYPSQLFICFLGVAYVVWAWGTHHISRRVLRSETSS